MSANRAWFAGMLLVGGVAVWAACDSVRAQAWQDASADDVRPVPIGSNAYSNSRSNRNGMPRASRPIRLGLNRPLSSLRLPSNTNSLPAPAERPAFIGPHDGRHEAMYLIRE